MGNETSKSIVIPFKVRPGVSGQDPRARARVMREFRLDEDDLTGFFSAYRMVDVHDRGFARMERFYRYFQIPRTRFYELVLWGEEGPYLETFTFEDFVFAMERFCGTNRDDLIRLIFRLYDEDKSGFLEMDEFDRLLLDAGGESWVHRFHYRGLFDRFGIADRGFARLRDFESIAKQFPSLFLHLNTLQREVRERVMGIEWWRQHLRDGGGASNVAAASSVVQSDDARSVIRRKAQRSKVVTDMRDSMTAEGDTASPLLSAQSRRLLLHRQASATLGTPTTEGRSMARTGSPARTRGSASRPRSGARPLASPSSPPSRGASRQRGARSPLQPPGGTPLRALEAGQTPGTRGSRSPAGGGSPPQPRSRPATGQSRAGGSGAGPAGWGRQALENMGLDAGELPPRTRRATADRPREQSPQGRLQRSRDFERAVRTQTARSRRRTPTPPVPYAGALVTRPQRGGSAETVVRAGRGLVPIYLASLPRTRRIKSPKELQELQKQAQARGLFGRGSVAEATRLETARQLRQLQRSAAQGHVARAMGLSAEGPSKEGGADTAMPRTVSGVKLRRMVTADPRKKVAPIPDRRDEIVATLRTCLRELRGEWWRVRREHVRETRPSWLDVDEVFEAAELDREEEERRKEEEDRRESEERHRAAMEEREREREREVQQMAVEDALAAELRAAEPSPRTASGSMSTTSSGSSAEGTDSDEGTSTAPSARPSDAEEEEEEEEGT